MKIYFVLFACLLGTNCLAQNASDTVLRRKDSLPGKSPVTKVTPSRPVVVSPTTDTQVRRRQNSADTARSLNPGTINKGMDAVKEIKQVPKSADTASGKAPVINSKSPDHYGMVLIKHPYFNFFGRPRYEIAIKRSHTGKDGLFYLMTALVLYFALVRLLFDKYMSNLFAVFFRVSLKQKQIREQLLQSPLPSLLLNIFFIISGGIYISFLLRFYNFVTATNLWFLMLYSTIALAIVYLVKFLILKMLGWMFSISEATDTYVFVIFLVNKLLGILLIPFLILLAFSSPPVIAILVTLSFTMVAIFFAYRYIISYAPVRKEIKVSQFHFFLYLCAFEIIPLLLIYKVLLTFLERNS